MVKKKPVMEIRMMALEKANEIALGQERTAVLVQVKAGIRQGKKVKIPV